MNIGQLKPGQLAMWGSAAWAKTQLTPGVSTLAAPLQFVSAFGKEGSHTMKVESAVRVLGLIAGWGALIVSLVLLNGEPVVGVLGILGGMALLLRSLATLCGEG